MPFRDNPDYFSNDYRRRVDPGNPSWRLLRRVCFVLTWGRDTVFPVLKARQLDHLTYRSLAREIPLLDVVPLSSAVHRVVTGLRDAGFRRSVNAALRCAALCWLALDAALVVSVGCVLTGHVLSLVFAIGWILGSPASIAATVATVVRQYL